MKKLPLILAGGFLFITLARVAAFSANSMQAGFLGWIFATGLGLAVFVSAYFTRVSVTDKSGAEARRSRYARIIATVNLVLFVVVDGFFNLAEVLLNVTDPNLQVAAWTYGIFPTVAAALLGALQGAVDRLPTPPRRESFASEFRKRIGNLLRRRVENWINDSEIKAQRKSMEIENLKDSLKRQPPI